MRDLRVRLWDAGVWLVSLGSVRWTDRAIDLMAASLPAGLGRLASTVRLGREFRRPILEDSWVRFFAHRLAGLPAK